MWKGVSGDIAWTLDSSYFKGCGVRSGHDREFVYWVDEDDLPDDNRDAQSRGAPRQLQRTGCV